MTALIYEKSGHYYISVRWNEHGKRFRKNCTTDLATTPKNERKAENSASKYWRSVKKSNQTASIFCFPTIASYGSKKLNLRYHLLPFMNTVFKSAIEFILGSMSALSN